MYNVKWYKYNNFQRYKYRENVKVVQTWQNEFETSYRQLLLFELIPDGGSNNGCLPKVMSTNKVSNKAVKSFCFFLTLYGEH